MAVIIIIFLKIKDMDNFRIDITSDKKEDFVSAFNIIMNNVPGNKAEGYKMDGDNLILYWVCDNDHDKEVSKFPRPMYTNDIINFVWSFISNSDYEKFDMEKFKTAMRELDVKLHVPYQRLSRGEKMKFQMSFAMAYSPKLYLLDEVTAGMDPVFRLDFYKILQKADYTIATQQ